VIEASLRFNVGCRIWLGELMERDNIDQTGALFSESQSRVIVTVGREDDVKFQALCEARGVPVLRIGVTDKESEAIDIQGIAKLPLSDVRRAWQHPLFAV
jgi:phosphoribosylformylglycinamidine synthase